MTVSNFPCLSLSAYQTGNDYHNLKENWLAILVCSLAVKPPVNSLPVVSVQF